MKKEKAITLINAETGEKEWQTPVEKQIYDNGNDDMYNIILEDENGKESELLVSEEHKVYVWDFDLGNTLYPKLVSVNNFPLKFEESTILNNLSKEKCKLSINGGCMLINTMPSYSLGGYSFLLMKCLSKVNSTLFSDLAKSAISSSSERNITLFTSNPSSFSCLINSTGIFSSQRSLDLLLEGNISFPFYDCRSILESSENCFFCQLREIIFENFFRCNACSEQFNYLPDHNSCAFESKLTVANLTVCNNAFVNFNSHCKDSNNNEIFKLFYNRDLTNFKLQKISEIYDNLGNLQENAGEICGKKDKKLGEK